VWRKLRTLLISAKMAAETSGTTATGQRVIVEKGLRGQIRAAILPAGLPNRVTIVRRDDLSKAPARATLSILPGRNGMFRNRTTSAVPLSKTTPPTALWVPMASPDVPVAVGETGVTVRIARAVTIEIIRRSR